MTEPTTTLKVTFVSESAAYKNTFGWYNRVTGYGGILFADVEQGGYHAPLTPGVSSVDFTVNTADLGNIEFFLISDGYNLNQDDSDDFTGAIKVIQLANGSWAVADVDSNGNVKTRYGKPDILQGEGANALFTETSKNAGGVDYASSVAGSNQTAATLAGDRADGPTGLLAWEDLAATRRSNGTYTKPGDADYNDAVFQISTVNSNRPPVAVNDAASATEAGGVNNATPGVNPTGNVLANDTDPDVGDTKTLTTVGAFAGAHGTLTLNADGSYSYAVNNSDAAVNALRTSNDTLTDTFNYTMRDTAGATSSAALTVTIHGANDAPVAVADSNSGDPVVESGVNPGNTPFAGDPSATGNVLANDTDVDSGDTKSVTAVNGLATNVGTAISGTYGTLMLGANGQWTYSLNDADPDTQALAQNEPATDVFTYTVADAAGATSSTTLTINVTGTNDAPVITGGATLGAVQEDGQLSAGGTLTATDIDHGATRTWTIVGGSPPTLTADYHFQIDDFRVIRNGLLFYSDGFDNNVAPPSGGLFLDATTGTYSIGPTNTVTESGGRVNMDGAFGVPFAIGTGLGHFVTLNTDTSTDLARGLKIDDDFTVEGRFDLISPDIGESYRIRVGDSVGPALGDDTIQLSVTRDAAGVLRVQLNELDFVAGVSPFISSVVLNPAAGDDQIVLRLTHQAANPGVITASYDLLGVVTFTGSLPGFGQIFGTETPGNPSDDEVFTRAEFGAGDNFAIKSALNGVYGTMTVNQAGNWHYDLANGQANVQALAQGETVTDTFQVQVTDQFGASDTETVNIAVTGQNDAPVITGGALAGSVAEDAPINQATGQITAVDVDHFATQTWTVVGGTLSTNADYHFRMDSFSVVKGATVVLQDDFSDGLPPPNSPPLNPNNTTPTPTNYAGLGSFTESGGKLFLDSNNAVSFVGVGTPDPFIGQDAIVRTNIDPANIGPGDLGLKVDNQFTITGVFDLVLPDSPRETYGIRFTDRLIGGMGTPPDQQGNNVVELVVREGVSGQLQVALRNLDFSGNVTTNIQSVPLAPPPGADQIILVLNHNPNDTFATASFKYIDHNNPTVILGSQSFSAHAAIFQGENWGRAELVAYAPLFTDSLKAGTYGTLDIGQSGTWNYVLNNSLAATQSLAQGQHATDSFTVQVADQFGAADTRVINIDVVGSNDTPILQTPPAFRSLTENGAPVTATGQAQFADVDLADSHSMSTMLQSTTTTGGAIVSPGLATALQTALNAFIFDPSTGDGHGQCQWDFNLSDSAVQYLSAGQSVTANYLITVMDSSPSRAPATPQLVAITINGNATPPPPPPPPPIVPTFVTLDYPGAGYTLANDINDNGEVVGQTGAVAGSSYTGFDFAGGHFTPIAVTGATNTSANTVNDNGLVGGWYEPSGSTPRYGFTDLSGTYTPGISLLPNISTTVDGMNNGGVFVGSLYHGGTSFSGYINNGGAVTQLDVSGAATTSANGINDGGDVVGSYNNAHGFLYHNGTYTTIDAPLGVNGTIAADINDSGQIVGWYTDAGNKAHGFVDIAGVFTTIDDPLGVNGTYVRGINDMGQVVGWYTDAGNVNHGFIANIAGGTVAMGFPSNDTLNGTPANDLILGLDGHDTMFSGLGNDVIDGGLGTDIVVYSGAYSGGLGSYTIAIMPGAIHASVSGPDGSDKLSNVEFLSFSDAYVMASNNVDISVLGAGALVPLLPIIGISGGDFLTIGTNANGHPIDLGDGPFDNLFLNQPGPATYSLNLSNVEQVFGVSGDDETVNMVSALSGVIIDLGWGNDRLDLADGTNVADVRHVETINGGSGSDTLALGDAHTTTTVDGHGGADVFDLSAHSQSFVFHDGSLADSPAGFGYDTIDGFDASLDIIDLQGLSIDHWDVTGGVLHAYQAGSGTPDLEIALPNLLGTLDNSHVLF